MTEKETKALQNLLFLVDCVKRYDEIGKTGSCTTAELEEKNLLYRYLYR